MKKYDNEKLVKNVMGSKIEKKNISTKTKNWENDYFHWNGINNKN